MFGLLCSVRVDRPALQGTEDVSACIPRLVGAHIKRQKTLRTCTSCIMGYYSTQKKQSQTKSTLPKKKGAQTSFKIMPEICGPISSMADRIGGNVILDPKCKISMRSQATISHVAPTLRRGGSHKANCSLRRQALAYLSEGVALRRSYRATAQGRGARPHPTESSRHEFVANCRDSFSAVRFPLSPFGFR